MSPVGVKCPMKPTSHERSGSVIILIYAGYTSKPSVSRVWGSIEELFRITCGVDWQKVPQLYSQIYYTTLTLKIPKSLFRYCMRWTAIASASHLLASIPSCVWLSSISISREPSYYIRTRIRSEFQIRLFLFFRCLDRRIPMSRRLACENGAEGRA